MPKKSARHFAQNFKLKYAVCYCAKHWQGCQHILRVLPSSSKWAGYLYAWLSSEWALPLIRRHTNGAVVFKIDQHHLAEVPVPLLADEALMGEINNLVLRANELRYNAFTKEQDALRLFNKDVLGLPVLQVNWSKPNNKLNA